jgi:hypothetical protein
LAPDVGRKIFTDGKIPLFIDGANFHHTAEVLGFEIDFMWLYQNLKNADRSRRCHSKTGRARHRRLRYHYPAISECQRPSAASG